MKTNFKFLLDNKNWSDTEYEDQTHTVVSSDEVVNMLLSGSEKYSGTLSQVLVDTLEHLKALPEGCYIDESTIEIDYN